MNWFGKEYEPNATDLSPRVRREINEILRQKNFPLEEREGLVKILKNWLIIFIIYGGWRLKI